MNANEVYAYGQRLASQYGLSITSHVRTPQRNRQVGGAPNSDHLTGLAIDLAGDPAQMAALAQWARANMGPGKLFRWVGWGDAGHKDHVHLSFNAAAAPDAATSAAAAPGGGEEVVVAEPTHTHDGEVDDLPPTATEAEIREWIKKNDPEHAYLLQNDEVFQAIVDWVRADEPIGDLEARIRQTTYWRTHGPESRAFDAQLANDPKAAEQRINETKILVDQAYQRQGIKKSDAELGEIAKGYIRGGWTPDDLERHVANELLTGVTEGEGLPTGADAAADADALVALAAQYLVPISRKDAETWASNIAAGRATQDSFTAWVTSLARARYAAQPDILAALEQGTTPAQYFAGHKATVAQILELDDSQVDLMDPRWMWMVETVDEKGNRRAPTLGEVAQMARDRPEYENTRTYKSTSAQYALGLADFFGEAA